MFDKLTDFVLFLQVLGTPVYESAYHRVIVMNVVGLVVAVLLIAPAVFLCKFCWGRYQECKEDYGDEHIVWTLGVVAAVMGVGCVVGVISSIINLLTADYQAYVVLTELFTK